MFRWSKNARFCVAEWVYPVICLRTTPQAHEGVELLTVGGVIPAVRQNIDDKWVPLRFHLNDKIHVRQVEITMCLTVCCIYGAVQLQFERDFALRCLVCGTGCVDYD